MKVGTQIPIQLLNLYSALQIPEILSADVELICDIVARWQ